jgi:alpha-tubulin suppressor-like RCC1 family protein/type II secretory pathway pseudopilin PulG
MRRGFSLIELAIILVFAGIISGLALHVRQNSMGSAAGDCSTTTKMQLVDIQAAMDRFVRSKSRYPVPAQRNVGVENPNFGREVEAANVGNALYIQSAGAAPDQVYYGALPFQALGLSPSYAGDCWGNKFTYVVTQSLTTTNDTTFNATTNIGKIAVNNQAADPVASNIAYAVISHGEDGYGASKLNASDAGYCALVAGVVQTQNCDNGNAILMTAPFSNGKDAGNAFFDDLIVYEGKAGTLVVGTTNGEGIGDDGNGQVGNGTPPYVAGSLPAPLDITIEFKSIVGGGHHACGIAMNDDVYCWGKNSDGQLGDGTTVGPKLGPVAVTGSVIKFKQLALGSDHSCGIAVGGPAINDKIYCWGDDSFGQLGNDPALADVSTPAAVLPGVTFKQISSKNNHTCAIGTNDITYCWGNNSEGGVGNGAGPMPIPMPQPVSGSPIFTKVAVGGLHTCAINAARITYCWGRNDEGQLATGPIGSPDQASPTLSNEIIKKALSFVDIVAGTNHTCGLSDIGEAYCWGDNSAGQLGDAAATTGSIAKVLGGHRFTKLVGGGNHTCGLVKFPLANEGEVYCWGNNSNGQLGNASAGANSATPVMVDGTDTNPAYDIGAGTNTTYILRPTGTLLVGTLPTLVPAVSADCRNGACGYPAGNFTCRTPCAQATTTDNECIAVPSSSAASNSCVSSSTDTQVMNCSLPAAMPPFAPLANICAVFDPIPTWSAVGIMYAGIGAQGTCISWGLCPAANIMGTACPVAGARCCVSSGGPANESTVPSSIGDTGFTYGRMCGVGAPPPPPATCPLPWGGTIADGASVVAYSSEHGSSVAQCETLKQTRTCTAGVLGGSAAYSREPKTGWYWWDGTVWDIGNTPTCSAPSGLGSFVGETYYCCGETGAPPPVVNGTCGATGNTCTAGTPISFVAGPCGGTDTWTCQGSGGGTDASCTSSAPPSACDCTHPTCGSMLDGHMICSGFRSLQCQSGGFVDIGPCAVFEDCF